MASTRAAYLNSECLASQKIRRQTLPNLLLSGLIRWLINDAWRVAVSLRGDVLDLFGLLAILLVLFWVRA